MIPIGANLTFSCIDMVDDTREDNSPDSANSAEDRDYVLMRRIAAGDEEAFRELVERHQGTLIGVLARMVNDPAEAEDLAQKTFLRVWKHAKRWKPQAKFTTYLFTIARNLAYNETRRRSRRREISSDQIQESSGFEPRESPENSPDVNLEQAEIYGEIEAALAALPENQRMAVILFAYENLSYEEIGKVLKTSLSSVKSLIFRARNTLRQQLDHLPRQ